jgi:hypothetical protein
MSVFFVNKGRAALSTTNDSLTFIASATKPLKIMYGKVAGQDSSSSPNEVLLQVSTGGTTPGGFITPEKADPGSAAASFTVATTWAAQPSLSGGPKHRFSPNANGGIDPYVTLPGAEIFVPVGTQVSVRSAFGTGNATFNFTVEEIG